MNAISSTILVLLCLVSSALSQIQSGHSVIIHILGVQAEEKAKIDSTYPVSEEGKVNMPYIGEIHADGLRAAQLSKKIETAYRDGGIFANPTIQVMVNQGDIGPVDLLVHIGGHVKQPGPRPFTKGLTVYQAIQAAGGADPFGAMNRVILYRAGKQQLLNMKHADGKEIVAMAGDTIEVPEKNMIGK